MELVTGYGGKLHVQAGDIRELYAGIFGEDTRILPVGNRMEPKLTSANELTVKDGSIMIQGAQVRIRAGDVEKVTIENGTVNAKRQDLVVVRYEKDEKTGVETAELKVIKGTVASTPTDPVVITGDIRAGDLIHEEPVFRVCLDGVTVTGVEQLVTVAEPLTAVKEMIREALDERHPVGSLYVAYNNSTSPAQLFGGSWEQIKGKFLYCNEGTATGGSTTHRHWQTVGLDYSSGLLYANSGTRVSNSRVVQGQMCSYKYDNYNASGSAREDATYEEYHTPPYLTVYAWRRIA